MSFLKHITLTVCVLSIIYTVLMMLVPDRFRRELRSVLSLLVVVSIGAMLLGADLSDISSEFSGISFSTELSSHDYLVQSELEERLAEYIESFLAEEGTFVKKVSVGTTIDEQRRISITKASLILDEADTGREQRIRALIEEKIGKIEVEISYEDS